MDFNHSTVELLQVIGFLTALLVTYRKNNMLVNGLLLWFVYSLSFDVFVLNCIRPQYVPGIYNSFNVLLGWIVLYEKFKMVFRPMVVFLVSLLR